MSTASMSCIPIKEILQERLGIEIDAHEIGYVALHIHSAIEDESVSAAMQMAGAIRECVQILERESGKKIDVMSLAYNRLMNHVKYMVMRAVRGESIKLDMNEYMEENIRSHLRWQQQSVKKLNAAARSGWKKWKSVTWQCILNVSTWIH